MGYDFTDFDKKQFDYVDLRIGSDRHDAPKISISYKDKDKATLRDIFKAASWFARLLRQPIHVFDYVVDIDSGDHIYIHDKKTGHDFVPTNATLFRDFSNIKDMYYTPF